jgi:hypothetical protein
VGTGVILGKNKMASSGVRPDASAIDKFNRLKLRKEFGYLLLCIADDSRIVVFEEGKRNASKNAFVSAISKQTNCCYGIFDDGKVKLFTWNPETATAKSKMLVASSCDGKNPIKFPSVQKFHFELVFSTSYGAGRYCFLF